MANVSSSSNAGDDDYISSVGFNLTEPMDNIGLPTHLFILYCFAYGLIWVAGLVGNLFVVVVVIVNSNMRNITNYFITRWSL